MSSFNAFLLGMIVMSIPSLLVVAWVMGKAGLAESNSLGER